MDQWEIDLRKQLEGTGSSGGTATQPKRPTVETAQPQPQPQRKKKASKKPDNGMSEYKWKPTPAPKKSSGSGSALAIVAISMLGLLFLAYNSKTNNSLFKWPSLNSSKHLEHIEPTPPSEPAPPPVDHSAALAKLVEDVAALQASDTKLQEQLSVQSRRTAFLGMLHNNNFVILKNNYPKNDLVFFNRDWTIDNMPKYLTLTAEDQAYLERYLRRD